MTITILSINQEYNGYLFPLSLICTIYKLPSINPGSWCYQIAIFIAGGVTIAIARVLWELKTAWKEYR